MAGGHGDVPFSDFFGIEGIERFARGGMTTAESVTLELARSRGTVGFALMPIGVFGAIEGAIILMAVGPSGGFFQARLIGEKNKVGEECGGLIGPEAGIASGAAGAADEAHAVECDLPALRLIARIPSLRMARGGPEVPMIFDSGGGTHGVTNRLACRSIAAIVPGELIAV
jgi:hypothetical protein